MCVCVCMCCENDCSAWLTRSSRKMMMEKGTKNAQCIVNENGKLTITGNQCWCKRTARAKGKQIINCAMLHLSPENFPYYYGFFSRARALAFAPTLPFVLCKTHTLSSSLCLHFSYSLRIRRLFRDSFLFVRDKFDICMQLKFDDSSCGNPFAAKWAKKKIPTRSNEQARKRIRKNWIKHTLLYFFMSYSNEMNERGSEFHNFILKRSAIDWIYCNFIERTAPISGDDDVHRHKSV